MATGVQNFACSVSSQGGKITATAEGKVPTSLSTLISAHMEEGYAHRFRDIGKYTFFEWRGPVLQTAYVSKAGPLSVTLHVNKCAVRNVIDFWTAESSTVSFHGRWLLTGLPTGGTLVRLHQTMDVPRWMQWLPLRIDSAVRARVTRAFEDMAALA